MGRMGGTRRTAPRARTVGPCPPPWAGRSGSYLFAHRRVDHTFWNSVFPGSLEGACEVPNPQDSEAPSVPPPSGSQRTRLRLCLPCPPDDSPAVPRLPRVTAVGLDGQITGRPSDYMIKKGGEREEPQPLRSPKGGSRDSPPPAGPGAELQVRHQPGEAENTVMGGRPPAPRASCWRSARCPSPDPLLACATGFTLPWVSPAATTLSVVFGLGLKLTSGRCPPIWPPPARS